MKKLVSILSASAIVAASVPAMTSSAVDIAKYVPSLSMKLSTCNGYWTITSNYGYINKNKINTDTIKYSANVNYKDVTAQTGGIFTRWNTQDKYITLSDLKDPMEAGYGSPFTQYTEPSDFADNVYNIENTNFCSASYYRGGTTTQPLGRANDLESPVCLAEFDIDIAKDVEIGVHSVDFVFSGDIDPLTGKTTDLFTYGVLQTPQIDPSFREFKYNKNTAKGVKFAVSDRELGDIDDNNRWNVTDASKILTACSKLANNKETGLSEGQLIAADVNCDGRYTNVDASTVLGYCSYISNPDHTDSIYSYLNKKYQREP